MATAPKSNSTLAFFDALSLVEREREGEVPTHLRDSSRDKEGFGHGEGYLYPHAYRDHWVAQQYLPAALQGRTFYQPGDQGYERGIREQVARRREAQLEAMLEVQGPPEVLTFHPGARDQDRWLQRTVSNAGERLGRLRDRVLDAARLQRHHVVLDLNAGSGLLTWEILRRVPEGGTWALARDARASEALRQQAARLPEVERPVVLAGEPGELADLLALRGEGELRFDAIAGRNALGALADPARLQELEQAHRAVVELLRFDPASEPVMRLALKIDVDTLRGTREGVPTLVELLRKHGVTATFLFSLGPDHTGRAIKRVFRPGFLGKVRRTSVLRHYGVKTLLYGTLLPGPDIGRRAADVMRGVRDAGHETGVHCWDHIRWQDGVARRDAAWTRAEMSKAVERFTAIFGTAPRTHGAAGWQMNRHALRLERESDVLPD